MEESVPLEMDNHVLDKEDGCYDNADATFSDDEEELNNKGERLLGLAVRVCTVSTLMPYAQTLRTQVVTAIFFLR